MATPLLPSLPLLAGFERFRSDMQVTPEQRVVRLRDVLYFPEFRVCVHAATKRLLSDGVTSRNNRLPPITKVLGPPDAIIEGPAVPFRTNSIGYAHSLLDDIPRAVLADQLVPPDLPLSLLYTPPLHNVEQFVFDQLLSSRCSLVAVDAQGSYRLRDAWIPSTVTGGTSLHPPGWYADLLYQQTKREPTTARPTRLILSRNSALRRRMTNEQELADALSDWAFQVVDLSKMSIDEQAQILRGADMVVSPHGAALANLIWTRGCRVIEIFPNTAVQPAFYLLAASLGLEWHYVLGSGSDRHSDFDVPVERVRQLVAG